LRNAENKQQGMQQVQQKETGGQQTEQEVEE